MKTRFTSALVVLSNLAVALQLGAGIWFVIIFAIGFIEPMLPKVPGNDPAGQWEIPRFTRDGELHLVSPGRDQHLLNYGGMAIQMPNSVRPVDAYTYSSLDPSARKLSPRAEWIEYPRGIHNRDNNVKLFSNGGRSFEVWYLIRHSHPEYFGYFVGYEKGSRKRLGFIGRNGFQETCPTQAESLPLTGNDLGIAATGVDQWQHETLPDPCTDPLNWEYELQANRKIWMATREGVWQCDLGTRSVKPFAPMEKVEGLYVMRDHQQRRLSVVVRTRAGVQLFDDAGKQIAEVNYPMAGNDFLTLSLTDSGNTVLVVTKYIGWAKETSRTVSITWFDPAGKKIKEQIQPLKFLPFEEDHVRTTVPVISLNRATVALSGALPEAYRSIKKMIEHTEEWFPAEPMSYRISNAVLTLLALGWLWRHQARYQASKSQVAIWTGFVALFGVVGLLGYLYHKRWPALVRCQECGQKSFTNGPGCPHCAGITAEPAILGRDVVEAEITPMLAQSA